MDATDLGHFDTIELHDGNELQRFETIYHQQPANPFITPSPEKPLPAPPAGDESDIAMSKKKFGNSNIVIYYLCKPINGLRKMIGLKFEDDPVKAADKARKKGEKVQRDEVKKQMKLAKKEAKRATRSFNGISWGYDRNAGTLGRSSAAGNGGCGRSGCRGRTCHHCIRESVTRMFSTNSHNQSAPPAQEPSFVGPVHASAPTLDMAPAPAPPTQHRQSRITEMFPASETIGTPLMARGDTWGVSQGAPGARQ